MVIFFGKFADFLFYQSEVRDNFKILN